MVFIPFKYGELRITNPGIVADFLSRTGIWEDFLVEDLFMELREDDVFLDIGANVGFYPVSIGRHFRNQIKVIAFEPEPTNYADLVFNIKHNKIKNVITEPKAVLDYSGKAKLKIQGLPEWSRIVDDGNFDFEVDCIDISSYLGNKSFNIAKIDTEAKEFEIISGMKKHLSKGMIIYLESDTLGKPINKIHNPALEILKELIGLEITIKYFGEKHYKIRIR